ncbi:MAG: HesA/MoeB/ThiF family protein [Muribaculaceae bacterium]
MKQFTFDELMRYDRHIKLREFGESGQRALCDARVLVIGAGGLGSPILMYLAAAGVGTLGVVDGDEVDVSNLQRQIVHDTANVGVAKVDSAQQRIAAINPCVKVEKHAMFLTPDNIGDLISRYDFVVEATDNFAVKYMVNDACVAHAKPFCLGGILRFEGQVMTYVPGAPCYRCLFPEPPEPSQVPSGKVVGVLGVIPGITGTLQATEVIKWITKTGDLLVGRLLTFDALAMRFDVVPFGVNRHCKACSGEKNMHDNCPSS